MAIDITLPFLNDMKIKATGSYSKSYLPDPEKKVSVSYLDIRFESGSAEIGQESDGLLQELAQDLNSRSDIEIEIIGHTDDVGSEEDNQKLSEDRAKAVMVRLISLGVDDSAIDYSGDGEKSPIASNSTEQGRMKNRRTELKITVR
jgi:outer membrane protein OmpA-like peptidoglycan-associated protein